MEEEGKKSRPTNQCIPSCSFSKGCSLYTLREFSPRNILGRERERKRPSVNPRWEKSKLGRKLKCRYMIAAARKREREGMEKHAGKRRKKLFFWKRERERKKKKRGREGAFDRNR